MGNQKLEYKIFLITVHIIGKQLPKIEHGQLSLLQITI